MDFYLGQLILYGFQRVPAGCLPCDGRLLPVSQYQALFSLLGSRFGGDGVSNFAIPDLRGRAALGAGQPPSGPAYPLGQRAGAEQVSLSSAELPLHTHPMNATTEAQNGTVAGALFADAGTTGTPYGPAPAGTPVVMQPEAMLSAGGGQAHENRQPYLVMNWAIAVTGVYPPRS